MSNFNKVVEFNKSFGVTTHDTPQKQIFTQDEKLVKLRKDLILEEVSELVDAMKNHDMVETTDALADILYVVYGAASSFGIDIDKAFDIVHKSNMSKLCTTEEEAKQTVEWYQQKYKSGEQPYDTPTYRKSDDGKYWVVFNESSGKILKSINYTPAEFSSVLN